MNTLFENTIKRIGAFMSFNKLKNKVIENERDAFDFEQKNISSDGYMVVQYRSSRNKMNMLFENTIKLIGGFDAFDFEEKNICNDGVVQYRSSRNKMNMLFENTIKRIAGFMSFDELKDMVRKNNRYAFNFEEKNISNDGYKVVQYLDLR